MGSRHLLRACHSDVAKSRLASLRGCDSRFKMIIVWQGLKAMGARIGCFRLSSCKRQGPRINAGIAGYEEDLNA